MDQRSTCLKIHPFCCRYWIFAGATYYPSGGFKDFHKGADTHEDTVRVLAECNKEWKHVLDTETGEVKIYGVGP
jgi:hypothetical protein